MLNDIPGVSAKKPKAAFYIFPKLDVEKFNIYDDEKFALDLLREKRILIVHGGGFNWGQPDHFRVLNYFQDCSVFHSESVGRGTAVQEELGRAWVLTGWQIEFRRAADLGESIRISTWPHGFRGFVGERNFLMETLDGEVLACADSSWAGERLYLIFFICCMISGHF